MAAVVALSSFAALAAVPATGWAATVQVEEGIITFTAASGEANRLDVQPVPDDVIRMLDFRDDGAPLTAGPGCEDLGDVVRCVGDGTGAAIQVRDGADRVRMEHHMDPATIWGGGGDDDISGGSGSGSTTIHGGSGNDRLHTSNNGGNAVVTGDGGNDVLSIREGGSGFFAGGAGDDRIRYVQLGFEDPFPADVAVAAVTSALQMLIEGGTGDDLIEVTNFPAEGIDGGQGMDTLVFSDFGFIDAEQSQLETVKLLSGGVISGSRRADRLISVGGFTSIFALGGDDYIDVRNGVDGDAVDCGAGRDRVQADSGDIVESNCERRL